MVLGEGEHRGVLEVQSGHLSCKSIVTVGLNVSATTSAPLHSRMSHATEHP